MSYTSDIWLYPLQDWWRTVNKMSNFMYTERIGNFIFCSVLTVDVVRKATRLFFGQFGQSYQSKLCSDKVKK